jgi:hypothetical protein
MTGLSKATVIRRMEDGVLFPKFAPNGHGVVVAVCLLSGQQQTTFARREYFAF